MTPDSDLHRRDPVAGPGGADRPARPARRRSDHVDGPRLVRAVWRAAGVVGVLLVAGSLPGIC